MRTSRRSVSFFMVVLATLAPTASAAEDVGAMAHAGRHAEAYAQGWRERNRFGDPAFDLPFGIAAIESGHAGDGVMALERYVLLRPDDLPARLHLARGYFLLGEDARSREEFESLKATGVPAEIAITIDRFLDALKAREGRYKPQSSLFVEAGLGSDSNANGGVRDAEISLPVFGAVEIAPEGRRLKDLFSSWGVGIGGTYPVAPGSTLFGSAQIDSRHYEGGAAARFDIDQMAATAGLSRLRDVHLLRVGATLSQMRVGGERYVDVQGVQGEWQLQVDARQSVVAAVQWSRLDYAGQQSARDADFTGAAFSWRALLPGAWQSTAQVTVNAGRQDSDTGRDDLVADILGARAAFSFTPAPRWGVSLGASSLHSDYRGKDVILDTARRDRHRAFDAAAAYSVSRQTVLRIEGMVARNRSNIALYDYPRQQLTIKVRHEFQ